MQKRNGGVFFNVDDMTILKEMPGEQAFPVLYALTRYAASGEETEIDTFQPVQIMAYRFLKQRMETERQKNDAVLASRRKHAQKAAEAWWRNARHESAHADMENGSEHARVCIGMDSDAEPVQTCTDMDSDAEHAQTCTDMDSDAEHAQTCTDTDSDAEHAQMCTDMDSDAEHAQTCTDMGRNAEHAPTWTDTENEEHVQAYTGMESDAGHSWRCTGMENEDMHPQACTGDPADADGCPDADSVMSGQDGDNGSPCEEGEVPAESTRKTVKTQQTDAEPAQVCTDKRNGDEHVGVCKGMHRDADGCPDLGCSSSVSGLLSESYIHDSITLHTTEDKKKDKEINKDIDLYIKGACACAREADHEVHLGEAYSEEELDKLQRQRKTEIPAIERMMRSCGADFAPMDEDIAMELLAENSCESVLKAIRIAKEGGSVTWRYIRGILRKQKESGQHDGCGDSGTVRGSAGAGKAERDHGADAGSGPDRGGEYPAGQYPGDLPECAKRYLESTFV